MKLRSIALSLLLSIASACKAKVVIWDLGGVLFGPSRMKMASSIGISRFLGYWFFDRKNPFTQLEPLLFDVLAHVPCPAISQKNPPCNNHGRPFPPIMCHWQAGTMLGTEITQRCKKTVTKLAANGYFVSKRERTLIEKVLEGMFDPDMLAHSMRPLRRNMKLFIDCAHELNDDGTLRNTNIALSNWDPESFVKLQSRFPYTFSHFDHQIISGQCGHLKPWQSTFEYLIHTYKLTPSECIFIDDQLENIKAAQAAGFATYHMRGNSRELRNVLIEFGALDY